MRTEDKEPLNSCAFCGQEIPSHEERFGFGAKANPGIDLSEKRGEVIEMFVLSLGRTVPAAVTGLASEAFLQGFDLYFMTCSETCALDLKTTLEEDREILEES